VSPSALRRLPALALGYALSVVSTSGDNSGANGGPSLTSAPGMLRTPAEGAVGPKIADIFSRSQDSLEDRLATFPRYARRAHITRFIALYELFKQALPVKGSVIDLGVFRGFSFMTFAKLSAVLEPNNLTRRVYGFSGFPSISSKDEPERTHVEVGHLASATESELNELIEVYDADRFLGHIPKAYLVVGDVLKTLPAFLERNQHLVISLLFLDLDLFEPTRLALELLLPRMPKGAVLAFDELDNPIWPGETPAAMEAVGLNKLRLERLDCDPYIAFARV
jgi:hypothetical protein